MNGGAKSNYSCRSAGRLRSMQLPVVGHVRATGTQLDGGRVLCNSQKRARLQERQPALQ
jgi:hypothetical protein